MGEIRIVFGDKILDFMVAYHYRAGTEIALGALANSMAVQEGRIRPRP